MTELNLDALHKRAKEWDTEKTAILNRIKILKAQAQSYSPVAKQEMDELELRVNERTREMHAWVVANHGSIANAKQLLDLDKENMRVMQTRHDGMSILEEWINRPSVLESNDCSRLHKLIESQTDGSGFSIIGDKPAPLDAKEQLADLNTAQSFVITHDWASVFKDHLDEADTQFRLPFPHCCFEMKISGIVVLALVKEPKDVNDTVNIRLYASIAKDLWLNFVPTKREKGDHFDFIHTQVVAMCIALEAEVAETEVIRAPSKLNEKRIKAGKLPLNDYHVVSLARRHRAKAKDTHVETGRKVRMHFRRGHWRRYESSKTWIKWMLVGDPHLGFIDKHYKL